MVMKDETVVPCFCMEIRALRKARCAGTSISED